MTNPSPRIPPALAAILLAYVTARALEIAPNSIPRTAVVALDVLSALAFALVAGVRDKLAAYGWHRKQIIFERYE